MSFEQLVADDGTRDEREEWPPAGSYRVDVDLTNCVMSAYDASGNLVRQAPVSYTHLDVYKRQRIVCFWR